MADTLDSFPQRSARNSLVHSAASSLPPPRSIRSSRSGSFYPNGDFRNSTSQVRSSRSGSFYPNGDFRNSTQQEITDMKCEVMVNGLRARQEEHMWTQGEDDEGVVLKKSRGAYTCAPVDLVDWDAGFFHAVQALNVKVAMTINTRVIRILLYNNTLPSIEIKNGLHLQVLPSLSDLPRCQKHQFAAFIADRGILVVWDDDPKMILARAERLENTLVKMIWGKQSMYPVEEEDKKEETKVEVAEIDADPEDPAAEKPRQIVLWQAIFSAFTVALAISALGLGWRQIAFESKTDHFYLRFLFALAIVPQFWLALFFFQSLVGNIGQIIGPVNQVAENSKYYSGKPPRRLNRDEGPLPHVTVQCPVYKEGLRSVIEPTIMSIKAAISTYEMQGGTANIFVNDDGMQLIDPTDAQARQDFYEEHNIGWVSRPRHNPNPQDGSAAFVRRGKFKKASNMNYALWVSARVEDRLVGIDRPDSWTADDETRAYQAALSAVIGEDEGRTWADGNIRMGDYILLIDSDTRVPTDCLLNAVSEMEQSPSVAIIQYSSGVMNVTDTFFERGITFFTNLIYTQIRFAVASGDVAPFVGHNAILRWSAVQEIAYECPDDNKREKYWSESTVSEDFDIALRLQTAGYVVRLGGYTGDGFKEGVSLTVYDELARWEKYAYGCNELMFYPVGQWFRKGIVTPLFRRFLFSKMPLPSKFTICAYIGTYYAIGSSLPLTLMNYFIIGWFNGALDHYYLDSFKVFVSIIYVFTALGNISLATLRYRTGEKNIFAALLENFSWILMLFIFLGGISLHVSKALLCHMFSIDITWGATNKEAVDTTFFQEIPLVIRRFKLTFLMCIAFTAMIVALAEFVPHEWRIDFLTPIFPLSILTFCHLALPIVLNPSLMLFTW